MSDIDQRRIKELEDIINFSLRRPILKQKDISEELLKIAKIIELEEISSSKPKKHYLI